MGGGGENFPHWKKTLAPLYVGETIISLEVWKKFLRKPNHLYPLKSQMVDPLGIFNAEEKIAEKKIFPSLKLPTSV